MIKRFSMIIAAAFAAAVLLGCTPSTRSSFDRIAEQGEMAVGVKGDTPPFGFRDNKGELVGFDVELAAAIALKLGVKPKFVPLATAERFPALLESKVDMLAACMTITRERERTIDFSMPYFETYQSLLVRADSSIADYVDLAGRKVGAAKGSTGMAMVKIVQPDADTVPFDGYDAALAALKNGEIDALATDHVILLGLAAGKTDQFKIVSRFGWEPYGLGIRENDSVLRGRINEALQELWDEGEYQRIYDIWFGDKSRYPTGEAFTISTFPKGNLEKAPQK